MRFQNALPLLLALLSASPSWAASQQSDAQIKRQIIQESLASYPGNCPCPYNMDRRGRACGRRSAYSRPGGYAPICYEKDVTQQMIQQHRTEHND